MKIITLSEIGYNAPSQTNWCYKIWKIDLINTKQNYCMSYTVKENFGGERELKRTILEKTGKKMIETKAVYTNTGTPKMTGLSTMLDIQSEEIENNLIEFIKGKK